MTLYLMILIAYIIPAALLVLMIYFRKTPKKWPAILFICYILALIIIGNIIFWRR